MPMEVMSGARRVDRVIDVRQLLHRQAVLAYRHLLSDLGH